MGSPATPCTGVCDGSPLQAVYGRGRLPERHVPGATLFNYCVGGPNDGLGCSNSTNCPAPGVCSKAGTLATLIRETGSPAGALTIGVAKPIKLGSVFCVAATINATVNANANLPAAGATSVTGTVTLLSN